jgi:hypothetical protein
MEVSLNSAASGELYGQTLFAMLRSLLWLPLLALLTSAASAQTTPSHKISVGLEQDVLPYATGGYYAGAWVGKGHLRVRALTARVHKPDLIVKKGFTHNNVTAYALVGDFFLKKDWQGWWVSTGLVRWNSSIQSDARLSTVHYKNYLLNGSMGYNIPLSKKFYLSPWAGMHLRIGGDKHFVVDGKDFTPPLLNPEASLKVGWRLR